MFGDIGWRFAYRVLMISLPIINYYIFTRHEVLHAYKLDDRYVSPGTL